MWRASAGGFDQLLADLRFFDRAHADCTGGGLDFQDTLVPRSGTVVA